MNPAIHNADYISRYLTFNIERIKKEGRESIRPPRNITVSEWADENRMLPETSVKPGPWRTDEAPHTREIMDCVMDPKISQITIMKSSQWAGTELMNNIIGYFMDIDPTTIMVMQPTEKDALDYANQKLGAMIEDTPCLRNKVGRKKFKDGENSVLRKKFIGGYLTIVSGSSTSSTRGRSARVTIGDDIDGIEYSGSVKEGDPVYRLIKRSTTFPDRLNINISTPTRDKQSRIQKVINDSDDRRYFVTCPYCQREQTMEPERLVWKKDFDMFGKVTRHYEESVRYSCINDKCNALWTEGERIDVLKKGKWIAQKPWIIHHAGFSGGEVMSTLSTMENVARLITGAGCDVVDGMLDTSKADQDKLEALFNTTFGRVYENILGEKIDPMDLMARVEDYININDLKVPDEVLMLVASVDVQGGRNGKEPRLEVKVMGFGLDEEAWVIYHGKIIGDPAQHAVWRKLDEFWQRKWIRNDGVELDIIRKFIDSGYLFNTVTDYCKGRASEGIWAIKGAKSHDAPSIPRHFTMLKGGARFISIGTQNIKRELFARLNNIKEYGPRFIHFTRCYCGSTYFKQLTSEVAVTKTTGLIPYVVYEPSDKHLDNEALDLMVYCFAAMKHTIPNFTMIKKGLDKEIKIIKVSKKNPSPYDVEENQTVPSAGSRPSWRNSDSVNRSSGSWRHS